MKFDNKLTDAFGIALPIIQGGMVWCSGWKLASAVAESGGLGVIGAGSMTPELLEHHLNQIPAEHQNKIAVNVPLFSKYASEQIAIIKKSNIKKVISSAGNPTTYTAQLKDEGFTVFHVIANEKFATKALEAGVDGLIAEGFEAGGHNGRDETTTLCLIPQIRKLTDKPLVAAGGIASGEAMFAALSLGADGVQVGSRFAVSKESSAHQIFKEEIIKAGDGCTSLTLKELTPVRVLKTPFWQEIQKAYLRNATTEDLKNLLGKGRSKKGIFEGNLEDGELEIGQVSAQINKIESVSEIITDLIQGFNSASKRMNFQL